MPKYLIPLLFGVALFSGCGGGGSPASSANSVSPAILASGLAHNVLPITVTFGPTNRVNLPLTSVTVCVPGSTSDCQTVDGIMIDTGSTGLRIAASALGPISLPQQSDANGNPMAECAQFVEGSSWGAVRIADVRIAGEQADSLPIQVIGDGDPAFSSIPTSCSSTGPLMNTVRTLAINGFLGVAQFQRDCGDACAQYSIPGIYYACPSSGCQPAQIPLSAQIANPVSMFADDNNGVVMQLPAIPATGLASADGTLIFGIGTQKNNALGNASVFTGNTLAGGITTYYNGAIYRDSIIDSGSNALFFADASIPACRSAVVSAGFDCPASTESLSATIQGLNGANASITFNVANAESLFANGFAAFNNLAGPIPRSSANFPSFYWGLPFFFGRNVFLAFENASVSGAPAGPFVAF